MKFAKPRTWEKMRLGVVWHYFNGAQYIPEVAEALRPIADFMGIVWSMRNGDGRERTRDEFEASGKYLKPLKLETVRYEPRTTRNQFEVQKRNQAIDLCKAFACTHFLSIDPQEILTRAQLEIILADIQEYDYHTTIAQYVGGGFVPLVYSLDERRFGKPGYFPVDCEPTRRLETGRNRRYRIYVPEEGVTVFRHG